MSLDRLAETKNFNPVDPKSLEEELIEAENILQAHKDFLQIQKKILELPVKYQEVISLRYFESKSNQEICEILGKKEGTVKSQISRGLKLLKKKSLKQ